MNMRLIPIHRTVRWPSLRRIAARFDGLWRAERRSLRLGLASAIGVVIMEILRPWPLKVVFDFVLLERPGAGGWAPVAAWVDAHRDASLLLAAGAVVLFTVLQSVMRYRENITLIAAAQRMIFALRCRVHAHLQRLSLDFHDASQTGDLLMRLTGDVRLLAEMLSGALLALGSTLILLFAMTCIMLLIDPLLALVSLAVLPLLSVAVGRLTGELRTAVQSQRRSEGAVAAAVHEALLGVQLIQSFGREADSSKSFARSCRRSLREGLRARRLQVALQSVTLVLLAVGLSAVVGVGAWRVRAGALSPGDLLVFLAYLESMYRPINRLAKTLARLTKAVACGERILEVLDREPLVKDAPDAIDAGRVRGAVEFERVTFGYELDRRVLRRISFRVEPGELVALVGMSGAGKTTVLNLLLRFYDPRRGRVLIDGTDIRRFTLGSLRRQVSAVLQEPLLFGMTIHENIAFGTPTAARAAVEAAARRAGADAFIEALPEGYDTVLSERATTLSGGQRRLVAIARALLRDSPVLVFDEATSGLDAETQRRVSAAMERLVAGRTAFVIAHRLATVLSSDRILVLHRGKLIAQGRHPDLYATCSRYRELCDLQFGGTAGMMGVELQHVSTPRCAVAGERT